VHDDELPLVVVFVVALFREAVIDFLKEWVEECQQAIYFVH